uniref:sn-1-specific diacylglycerol lipase n=1 Tax=Amphora coffeiformis TaxID=265554 RepID=A0A7S3L1W3_9STRA|mmetsp:Transcript_11150/g.21220  ORF Transcript_11150/g.21220 Transcript_11150/m.21220 type:complete len:520 (+) Transcript_11150:80-1639(+)
MDSAATTTSSTNTAFLWWHPRTLLLGGAIAYVAVGYLTLDKRGRRAWFRPVTMSLSAITVAIGFAVSLVTDIQDAIEDGRTKVWQQAMDALQLFLKESGLEDEFSETMSSSHFIPSLMILTDLQNKVQRQRRVPLRQPHQTLIEPADLTLGSHYMRYATAVYGTEMMASTQLAVYDTTLASAQDTTHEWIAKHVHLDPSSPDGNDDTTAKYEIWCDYTRDPTNKDISHAQHTMVVCDHTNKVIVLTIRGTFSLSGIITDLAGYCEDYCGGMAHAGMACAAQETWDSVWNEVLRDKLAEGGDTLAEYSLVVTGHSLGAGVACLVTILIYHLIQEKKLPTLQHRRIQCYAMAPPPVFEPLSAAPEAVSNTVAYIHQYDCVPSLSVDGVRRLMACLGRIQKVLLQHPLWELAARRWELGEPEPELLEAYQQPKEPLRELDKAPMLFIPARQLIWLEKQVVDDQVKGYEAHPLDPTFYADRVLDLEAPDCVMDHLASEYETAFAKLLGSGQFGGDKNTDDTTL